MRHLQILLSQIISQSHIGRQYPAFHHPNHLSLQVCYLPPAWSTWTTQSTSISKDWNKSWSQGSWAVSTKVAKQLFFLVWEIFSSGSHERKALARRRAQQKRDYNLALVLICTILIFLATHTPRIVTGLLEAVTIGSVLACQEKGQGYLRIWHLYLLNGVNLLQVTPQSITKYTLNIYHLFYI